MEAIYIVIGIVAFNVGAWLGHKSSTHEWVGVWKACQRDAERSYLRGYALGHTEALREVEAKISEHLEEATGTDISVSVG